MIVKKTRRRRQRAAASARAKALAYLAVSEQERAEAAAAAETAKPTKQEAKGAADVERWQALPPEQRETEHLQWKPWMKMLIEQAREQAKMAREGQADVAALRRARRQPGDRKVPSQETGAK